MEKKIELYQPANGTEGGIFWSMFCDECVKNPIDPEAKNQCQILCKTMMHRVTDPEYPKQWRYVDGRPVCTAFKSREAYNAERRASPRASDTDTIDMFQMVEEKTQ